MCFNGGGHARFDFFCKVYFAQTFQVKHVCKTHNVVYYMDLLIIFVALYF